MYIHMCRKSVKIIIHNQEGKNVYVWCMMYSNGNLKQRRHSVIPLEQVDK